MKVLPITDPRAKEYGRIVTEVDTAELQAALEKLPMPEDSVVYVAEEPALQCLKTAEVFEKQVYGCMPIQMGYCNGCNHKMDAMEYHRDSEFNYAATDLILILGRRQDIAEDFTYDSAKAEAFFVPKGTMIETYATTLHYAPVTAEGEKGFRMLVVLPKGTNYDLKEPNSGIGEDKLRTATNKWLIAHPEANIAGAFNGIVGENITI